MTIGSLRPQQGSCDACRPELQLWSADSRLPGRLPLAEAGKQTEVREYGKIANNREGVG
jgi:hypothetical protein